MTEPSQIMWQMLAYAAGTKLAAGAANMGWSSTCQQAAGRETPACRWTRRGEKTRHPDVFGVKRRMHRSCEAGFIGQQFVNGGSRTMWQMQASKQRTFGQQCERPQDASDERPSAETWVRPHAPAAGSGSEARGRCSCNQTTTIKSPGIRPVN